MSDIPLLVVSVVASLLLIRRFVATRQCSWLLGPAFWAALVTRHYVPNALTTLAAGGLLCVWVGAVLWRSAVRGLRPVAPSDTPPPIVADEWQRAELEAEALSAETTPSESPLAVAFELRSPETFRTSDGLEQTIPPGSYQGTLLLEAPPRGLEETDAYRGAILWRFAFAAPDQQWWQASGAMHGFEPLDLAGLADQQPSDASSVPDTRPQHLPPPAVFWTEADAEMRESFARRCLLKGLELADDSRERFRIRVGGEWVYIHTKYIGWRVDLAVSGDGCRVWVRVVGMYRELWSHDPCSEDADEAAKATPDGCELTRAFVYPLPVEEFVPLAFPARHWPTCEAMHEEIDARLEEDRANEVSGSRSAARLTFSRLGPVNPRAGDAR